MARDLELRLIDAPVPRGEIAARDLVALVSALQELSTRVGRDVLNTPGPGRTKQFMEEFTELRLRAVSAGSTVLEFSKGPVDQLDVDLPEQRAADERFWEILDAISQDERPAGVSDLIAESAARLVVALRDAAPRATLAATTHRPVEFSTAWLNPEAWRPGRIRTDTQMEARGRLEKVDIRSHEFRVQDDVGNTVDLKHVVNDAEVALLVGRWVLATGVGVLSSGNLVALDGAVITALDDPTRSFGPATSGSSVEDLVNSVPGPDPDGGIDLTDDEFASFLDAVHA